MARSRGLPELCYNPYRELGLHPVQAHFTSSASTTPGSLGVFSRGRRILPVGDIPFTRSRLRNSQPAGTVIEVGTTEQEIAENTRQPRTPLL